MLNPILLDLFCCETAAMPLLHKDYISHSKELTMDSLWVAIAAVVFIVFAVLAPVFATRAASRKFEKRVKEA